MRVVSSGGHFDYRQKATLKLFDMQVFFNAQSLANILSLKDVANKYRVMMDTTKDKLMTVWLTNNTGYKFNECGHGLYSMNVKDPDMITIKPPPEEPPDLTNNTSIKHSSQSIINYLFLTIVAENKEYFTRSEIQGADNACDLQCNLGWPSDQNLITAIQGNQLINCPITDADM
jgi:hypothetical protein